MNAPTRPTPPRLIARQLATGFGAVTIVAIAMCAALLVIIGDVSGLVTSMRHDETAIRRSLELNEAVREQYLHIAHSFIEGDRSHLHHYDKWYGRVKTGLREFESSLPATERGRVAELEKLTREIDRRFKTMALPLIEQGAAAAARTEHRDIEALAEQATELAHELTRQTEARMAHAHVRATDSTRLGLLTGGLFVLLVVGLSAGFTLRMRSAVLRPLALLTDTARRLGAGDFSARAGAVGRGELLELAQAFDHMAGEIAVRERRLVQSERMAAIGQLAAGVAHELNNPIGIIRGYLRTMTPDSGPATLREELQILDDEAAQCQRIAEDLLAYARASELHFDRVRLRAFLDETVRRFRESPAAREATVEIDAVDREIEVDATRFRQVLLNLLLNAVQAAPDAPVRLSASAGEALLEIEVRDHGPGIAAEDRERVFEPFYSKRRGGSGLGLSVCLGIVRAHGGSIQVQDAPGGGARFCVRLPVRPRRAEANGGPAT